MWRIIVITLFCALTGSLSAGDKVTINVRQPDGVIRQQLLRLTPLDASAKKVFHFLQYRLHREAEVVGTPWPAVQICHERSFGTLFRATESLHVPDSCSGVLGFRPT